MRDQEIIYDSRRPKLPPPEFAGQWIAWDRGTETIIAHGQTLIEVVAAAKAAGFQDPLFERVRRPDEVLIGNI